MGSFLYDVALYATKWIVIVGAILAIFSFFSALKIKTSKALSENKGKDGHLKITNLSKKYHALGNQLSEELHGSAATRKKHQKIAVVLDFVGDMLAHQVKHFREEINAILLMKKQPDIVVIRLESPGGTAVDYGHAASQLRRLREAGIFVVVTVDRIAASGGYQMASQASMIHAAESAIVGSIGVVLEAPNLSRLYDKLGIEYTQLTGGEYKRTIQINVPNDPEALEHVQKRINESHSNFIELVRHGRHRYKNEELLEESVIPDEAFTGDHWTAEESMQKNLNLVDSIGTSDALLIKLMTEHEVYQVKYQPTETPKEKLIAFLSQSMPKIIKNWIMESRNPHNFS